MVLGCDEEYNDFKSKGAFDMNRGQVKQEIKECSVNELRQWRKHAVKCLDYFLKYRDDFEIEECNFVILHIDARLKYLGESKIIGKSIIKKSE